MKNGIFTMKDEMSTMKKEILVQFDQMQQSFAVMTDKVSLLEEVTANNWSSICKLQRAI